MVVKKVNIKKILWKNIFNWDGDLPLNKLLTFHAMTIIIRTVFEENGKFYPQIFLSESLYEL